jgi:hypothetical protein
MGAATRNKIRCVNCNFETPEPWHGKVLECSGECYTTYTLVKPGDDLNRVKMRLCEIFFVDEHKLLPPPDELDRHIEFKKLTAPEPGEYYLFAREYRVPEDEIEKLKNAALSEILVSLDALERLDAAMERFRRDLRDDASRDKLLHNIQVVEKLVVMIREKLELLD